MVNYLVVLFAVTLVYFASAERLINYIRLIGLQGLLLCGIAIFELKEVNTANLIFIASESLIFKAILIPYLLTRIINRSGVTKVHRLAMPGFYTTYLFHLRITDERYTGLFLDKFICQYYLHGHSPLYSFYRLVAHCNT